MNAHTYLMLFRAKCDRFAAAHNMLDGHDLTHGEVSEMLNEVTEQIRRQQGLSDVAHDGFKDMAKKLVFGVNKGRK